MLPPTGAGVHVLIIGVSEYAQLPVDAGANKGPPGYGFARLTAARSAYHVLLALLERSLALPVPLRSCRVLLSPTAREVANDPALVGWLHPARRASVENVVRALNEWRKDAISDADNISLFYFAGHGAAIRDGDVALLCDDFGDPKCSQAPLLAAVSRDQLRRCLWPTPARKVVPGVQYCLFDACRNANLKLQEQEHGYPQPVFGIPSTATEPATAVTLDAATTGRPAWSMPDRYTVFGRAVELALRHGGVPAAVGGGALWELAGNSLHDAMLAFHRGHPDLSGFGQLPVPDGPLSPDAVLLRLPTAPNVMVRFRCNQGAHHCEARVDVANPPPSTGSVCHGPPLPAELLLPGGVYQFTKHYPPVVALPPQLMWEYARNGLVEIAFRCP